MRAGFAALTNFVTLSTSEGSSSAWDECLSADFSVAESGTGTKFISTVHRTILSFSLRIG